MNIPHNIMPYGRQQPLGCPLHNRRPLAGPSPIPEEEAALLGVGDRTSTASGSAPQQVKSPRFVGIG